MGGIGCLLVLCSIFSAIEGIKNYRRYVFIERIKYYVIGALISLFIDLLVYLSSGDKDIQMLLFISPALAIIFGTIFYYIKVLKLNAHEANFRLLKYILFIFFVMAIYLLVFAVVS